jgi:FixJ family two-component response regulator
MRKILLMDDDRESRNNLISILSKEFKDIVFVEYDPVKENIPDKHFDWSAYDALILDHNLMGGGVTGIDLINANKGNQMFPATIMLTSEGSEDIAVRAMKSGVTDYMNKTQLSKKQLIQSIKDALENTDARRDRLDTINQVRHLANKESQKILSAYKEKYEEMRRQEEVRLKQEHRTLENELQKNKVILDRIKESKKKAQQKKHADKNEMANLWHQQMDAEAAIERSNWKLTQGEIIAKSQLEEDLKVFKDEMEQQENMANQISERMKRLKKMREEAELKAKDQEENKDKGLMGEISAILRRKRSGLD